MKNRQKGPGIMGVIGPAVFGVLMLALCGRAGGNGAAPMMLVLGLIFLGGAIFNLVQTTGNGKKTSHSQTSQ